MLLTYGRFPMNRVYVIAEAGSNHDGKLSQAKELIDVAAAAGADAVKFQTFKASALYPRQAGNSDYLGDATPIYDIIAKLEMPEAWIAELAQHCRTRKVDFLSTPFDEASANLLAPHVSMFKIASYEMTHHGLVQHCARFNKKMLISTGTATLAEVEEMVQALDAVGCKDYALMQCTASYPAPLHALNLLALKTLAQKFACPVGLSDHSREPSIGAVGAVALGAVYLEKHFTLRNDLPGPDHIYALEPHELKQMIADVRATSAALGDGVKQPQPEEMELRAFARRSVFAGASVAKGEMLTTHNVSVLRCGKLKAGEHPRRYLKMLGRVSRIALNSGDAPLESDLAPLLLQEGDVSLRALDEQLDRARVFTWRQDPAVYREMFSAAAPTQAEHDAWFDRLIHRVDRLEFVIEWKQRPVGVIRLYDIDFGARTAEYGIFIGEAEARGQGVGERASKAVLKFAFTVLGLSAVGLEYFADNRAAAALYKRLGFQPSTEPAHQASVGARQVVRAVIGN